MYNNALPLVLIHDVKDYELNLVNFKMNIVLECK